jgi:hypothetical protein
MGKNIGRMPLGWQYGTPEVKKNVFLINIEQACTTYGPRAKCGPNLFYLACFFHKKTSLNM